MPPKKRAMQKKTWKRPSEVFRVAFALNPKKELQPIGHGEYGEVFLGRLFFPHPTDAQRRIVKRVAIKRFKKPLSDELAGRYQAVIDALGQTDVQIPKMGMHKLENGEWVQIAQLFGATNKGSKLVEKSHFNIRTWKGKKSAIVLLTKLANHGFFPANDFIEPFKDARKGVIGIDIDVLARKGITSPEERAFRILEAIQRATQDVQSQKALYEIALKNAAPGLVQELVRRGSAYYNERV